MAKKEREWKKVAVCFSPIPSVSLLQLLSHSPLHLLSHSQAFASIFGFPFLPSFVPRKRKLQTKKEGIGNDDCGKEQGTMTVGRTGNQRYTETRGNMEAEREHGSKEGTGGNMRNNREYEEQDTSREEVARHDLSPLTTHFLTRRESFSFKKRRGKEKRFFQE